VPFHIYIYQTQIELTQEQAGELDMGEEIEALAASVRSGLPGQPGLISAIEMHSFDEEAPVRVIFQSIWESWADLQRHIGSDLDARRLLESWGGGYLTRPPESQIFRQIGV
jgi:heme-degrading monooxygenase HmoA